ncbi:MAG: hypothetical protein IBJ09_10620 [Bacteroidia bacterium]|nr:hypothetical protein [Bacteroidia bacterium]
MRKILYMAACAMLAVSCNEDADVTASKPIAKSGTSATFELFDETIEKSYSFSFTDLYTENAAYTYEELSTVEDSNAQFLVLLKPEDYDIVSSASGLSFTISLKRAASLVLTSNPGIPVSIASGGTVTVNCICKRGQGNCLTGTNYVDQGIIEVECVPDPECKRCKMQVARGEIEQVTSGIIYAK